jgi:hypothetical protein
MSPIDDARLRHLRLKEILLEASGLSVPHRTAFLDAACAGDDRMRRELESLLLWLDAPPEGPTTRVEDSPRADPAPEVSIPPASEDSGMAKVRRTGRRRRR